jgi:hypothetical protein
MGPKSRVKSLQPVFGGARKDNEIVLTHGLTKEATEILKSKAKNYLLSVQRTQGRLDEKSSGISHSVLKRLEKMT